MALREILKYPDPRLRNKALPVKGVTPELKILAQDMLESMYASRGIGLAAPQVGESVRLLVVDIRHLSPDGGYKMDQLTALEKQVSYPVTIFNPEIIKKEGRTSFDEGCLSVPGFYETVSRANEVVVRGLDLEGQPLEIHTDGLLAICLQHEIDHLEGKLFIDRLSTIKSARIKARIKKHGYPPLEAQADHESQDDDVAL